MITWLCAVCGVRVRVRAYATAPVRRTLAWLALFACDDEIYLPPPQPPPPARIGVKANPVLSNMKTAPPSSGSGGAAAAVPRKVIGRRASTTQFLTKAVLDVGYIIFLSSFFSSLLLQTRGHWHGVLPYCLPRQRWVEHSYLASPRGLDSAFGVSCTHVR